MNVIIVGSGAVAAELTQYIEDSNRHVQQGKHLNLLGYLDLKENIENYWAKYKLAKPVLGDINTYNIFETDNFLVGISNIPFRMKMISILKERGAKITGFIHYTSLISESTVVGDGNIIYPFCIIGPNCKIGSHNMVTAYSFISHDCKIGSNNFFSTAGLSGNVTVGDENFFGIRSTAIPNVSIGSRNVIQAGMTIDKDVESDSTVFYKFKEKVIAMPKA